ncbi:hypothetical protein MKX01_029645 [Papaver californicum]|nr:hypothetical protein MKX01_029645 [Papaver californicum]
MFLSAFHDQVITAQAQESTPNYLAWKFCLGTNYTANSTYRTNLNLLLSSLSATFTNNNTIPRYGYRNITIGESPDTVYGSLHCREDITPDICSECVQIATEVVKDSACPNSRGAIMFYIGFTLRYSDKYFFSLKEQSPNTGYLNPADKNEIPVDFTNILAGLLDDLVIEAVTNKSSGNSPSFFATGSTNYSSSNQVYGMVQCTPDITPALCNRCLRTSIGTPILVCCPDSKGGIVLTPSSTLCIPLKL